MKKDLTKIPTAYCYHLYKNWSVLSELADDFECSAEQYGQLVLKTIDPASHTEYDYQNFVNDIERYMAEGNKAAITKRVWYAIDHGKNFDTNNFSYINARRRKY